MLLQYCETKGIPLPTAAAVSTVDTGAGEAGDSDAAGGKAKEKPKRGLLRASENRIFSSICREYGPSMYTRKHDSSTQFSIFIIISPSIRILLLIHKKK